MRNDILEEIITDKELMKKYKIQASDLENLSTSFPNKLTVIEVMSTIINGSDNNISSGMIYKRIKNIHKI